MGTTLLVWPLLGRLLPPAPVGQLSGVLAVSSILAPVVTLGAHLHVANRLAREPRRAGGADGRLVRLLLVVLIAVAALGVIGLILAPQNSVLRVSAVVAATGCSILGLGVIRGLNRAGLYAALTIWSQFLSLLMLSMVAGIAGSLDAGLIVYVVALVMGTIVVVPLVNRQPDVDTQGRALRIGLQSLGLVPHLVLAVATLLLARIIVGLITGPVGLAGFQYASLLIGGVTTIGASLDAHWSTRAQAATTASELRSLLNRNLVRIQAVLVAVAAAVVIFVFVFLPVWLPPTYDADAVRGAVLVSLSAGSFQALADNRAAALMWLGRSGAVSVGTIVGVVVASGSCFLLVLTSGWEAAGAGIALGTASRALVTSVLLRRAEPALGLDRPAVMASTAAVGLVLLAVLLTQI
ncbi:hypothetical protein [Curtobacterium sp. VKM Ac-1393]|uniref:hypothetical protein n=1 Tax=Curtobacterium sp. VKM Ac-1393 TaxID=2783814 RepID=UPI00188C45CD|nr:hypothetical protein [Curtobacterium sp. VKM Ac-1393]MBF4606078.1 hypothetical protein [Curtobacterium sp. VKM Ac-1393]